MEKSFYFMHLWLFQCYTAHTRDSTGVETKARGCTVEANHVTMYCGPHNISAGSLILRKDYTGPDGHHAVVDCCSTDFCNNASFPELRPQERDGKFSFCFSCARSNIQ